MHQIMFFYQIFLIALSSFFVIMALSNIIWLRLSSRKTLKFTGKMVSVLIPARNEEENIEKCLKTLLAQTYKNYEILVLDDRSTDNTWKILKKYSIKYTKIKAFKGKQLPKGWHGKPYALHQLTKHAKGDYLIFTDADTIHQKDSISWAISHLEYHNADLLSGYLHQKIGSLGEAVIIPCLNLTSIILPLWLIHVIPWFLLTHAIGQMMVFRKEALTKIGGYRSVAKHITEDVFISRKMKKAGFRTIFLDISRHVSCRMYDGLTNAFNGITKNIFEFFQKNIIAMLVVSFVIILYFIIPVFLLLISPLTGEIPSLAIVLSVIVFSASWMLTMINRKVKWYYFFLYPFTLLSVLLMGWNYYKKVIIGEGLVWKDRLVK
jgi:chlorobactene glucosyltransferase